MHVSKLCTVILCSVATVIAVPTPWSESVLEDINGLRASGLSESEIALRFPRALFYPNPTNPSHEITLYSPLDLRTYKVPSSQQPNNHGNFLSTFLHKLGSPFRLGGGRSGECDDDEDKVDMSYGNDSEGGKMVWELIKEEDRRQGKGRFKHGVGRRGQEMGRKENVI